MEMGISQILQKKITIKKDYFFLNFINQTISGGTAAKGGNWMKSSVWLNNMPVRIFYKKKIQLKGPNYFIYYGDILCTQSVSVIRDPHIQIDFDTFESEKFTQSCPT